MDVQSAMKMSVVVGICCRLVKRDTTCGALVVPWLGSIRAIMEDAARADKFG